MRSVDLFVGTELVQGSGILRYGESQQVRLIPHGDGLFEGASGENTVTSGADSGAGNFRTYGIGDAGAK